jgi:uncharacterized Ntn-hydrolase superfamily protein
MRLPTNKPEQLDRVLTGKILKLMSRAHVALFRATNGRVRSTWRIAAGAEKPVPTLLLDHRGRKQLQCFGLGVASCALLLQPKAALATYSIAAVDSATNEVGGAITSCVGELDVGIVYGSLPGVGLIHAQAQLDQRSRGKTRALELLEQGLDPAEIIIQITRPELDPSFAARQYGIVDLSGRAAGYTGQQAQAYKNDQQGRFGTIAYSVQGNILTDQAVLDQATEALQAPACDLAERLMRALEAGALNGEGDSRCTGDGIPSDSAFIQVDRPMQSEPYLRLNIAGTRPDSPLPQLREMFDTWRATHPCAPTVPAAGSGGSSGAGGAGGVGASGASGTGAAGAPAAGAAAAGASATGAATQAGQADAAGSSAATIAGSSAAAAGANAGESTPVTGSAAGSGVAPGIKPPFAAAEAVTPTSGTAASVTNAIEQPPQATGGGCSLTPRSARASTLWIALPSLCWLASRTRRRRKAAPRA